MRQAYDFQAARRNPYAAQLKRAVTIRLDEGTLAYFRQLAADTGLPYQTLINLYLRECASSKRSLRWSPPGSGRGRRPPKARTG
jgi:predicted DNA binding CopG/RHH family protein